MQRDTRRLRILLVGLGLIAGLAACGDDSVAPAAAPPDATAAPDTTVPPTDPPTSPPADPPAAYDHATGADDVIVEIGFEGGFMPIDAVFGQLPTVLVTGDGRRFEQGPQIEIYPGPLLPNVQVATIGEDGIQAILASADEHGLLAPREYDSPTNIADASDAVVTIHVGGETFTHRAYALGLGDAESGERAELAAFIADVTTDVPPESAAFEPEQYLVRATPVTDLSGSEIEPTIVAWPAEIGVDLTTGADCVAIDATAASDVFESANQLTFFEQDGVTYQLTVKPQLPGDSC